MVDITVISIHTCMYMCSTFVMWPHYEHSCGFIAIFIGMFRNMGHTCIYMYNGKNSIVTGTPMACFIFRNNNELCSEVVM